MNKNELDRLKPGTIIRNKKDKQWCFLVSQVFPDKIIAVRTIAITDHKEWEIVEEKLEEPQKNSIQIAADELHQLLKEPHMIGINEPINDTIFIYYETKPKKSYNEWKGFKVEEKVIGKVAIGATNE